MVRANVEIDGLEVLSTYLNRVLGGVNNLRQFYPEIADDYEKIQRRWFDTQGNGSWQPLSPNYAAWKAEYAPGQPLLVLSGALEATPFREQLSGNNLTIRVDPPEYWRYHQFGTSRMPARPPYIIDASIEARLSKALSSAIVRFLSGI